MCLSTEYTVLDAAEWEDFKSKHSMLEGCEILADIIIDGGYPIPYVPVSYEGALLDFNRLKDLDTKDLIKEENFYTRYDYDLNPDGIIIKSSNVGNKFSNFFHQESRWMCDSINAPSPYRTWTNRKFMVTLLKALWTLKLKEVSSRTLRTAIAMRKYIASQFRPSSAKAIYNHFEAESVLDFSAGWGDRLAGFLASDSLSYTGIDPNSNLHKGYSEQVKHSGVEGKEIFMFNDCAESFDYEDRKFDLVFTSPPYFNIEKYSKDDKQSFKRYKKPEEWVSKFLIKSVESAWNALEVGGHMVVNISDIYSGHKINNLCDPMNEHISKLKRSKFVGFWGYQMAKRPNSTATRSAGTFAEPVWVWKKL